MNPENKNRFLSFIDYVVWSLQLHPNEFFSERELYQMRSDYSQLSGSRSRQVSLSALRQSLKKYQKGYCISRNIDITQCPLQLADLPEDHPGYNRVTTIKRKGWVWKAEEREYEG